MDDPAGGASPPLFSVVIPTFQRAQSVLQAVGSVLAQTHGDLEVIVVDDGSTDGTSALLAELDDPRLRVVALDHSGVGAARNAGIDAATGEFVTFLDSDDDAHADWLSVLASEIEAHDPELIRSAATVVHERSGRTQVAAPASGPARYPYGVCLPGTYAIRRPLLQRVGGFDAGLRFGENTELLLRVLDALDGHRSSVRMVDVPLVTCNRRARRSVEYG
nr:glycosyltransferase family 2 protein [Acidimicrobiia bacterium]